MENPINILFQVIQRLWSSALNGRPLYKLVLRFAVNFSPVFIWLFMFKNAGVVPNEWRPKIHVGWAYYTDSTVFSPWWFPAWAVLMVVVTFIWYHIVKNKSVYLTQPPQKDLEGGFDSIQLMDSDSRSDSGSSTSGDDSSDDIVEDLGYRLSHGMIPKAKTHALYLTPLLLCLIWPVLNTAHWFATPLTVPKDLTAWLFYVLAHITFPILTAVWLYVFHLPGALKCFSIALGLQNIAGVCTHMLFPTAPPWFIHMHGPEAEANYDMPGYAAGLTRVDVALGTHLHSKGFHKSPIVFGAVPSLHSAMAVQVCIFVWYFANSIALRILAIGFVCVQWWATMYLDHHFRIDLLIGCCYALISFGAIWPYIRHQELKFLKARRENDFTHGTTMGMRVFRGFDRIQRFFDPYH
ncbi:inositolphosphotransferase CYBJADRAFT_73751 [Cyberlindnera jadinii NRRL Y-1542]|uniref:Inositolphosphotransferase Aur1/Ipt1 domain-containing protein n=1 Tax=Cyberlindnera jadinii (strain ATCC 18201 / CBS 1600 / BCRC 20928 / JCM 3617 / NBRC 0987 / NRRL Y-1542) TaxID=983966 RepID=A0A1E4S4T7_CYBJN|nr:hypothetical protein CYBJADRAFT_73751 [Cyberlindnera jadinii NRRL Y-1542]ODV74463.1 hypothetical protein CYBJADRAFT_73751 [Cyberlindnera jadinii NRRL Y-1542]